MGVIFVAIPALVLFKFHAKRVFRPWTLLLGGVRAIAAEVKFMYKKMVDYETGILVLLVTAVRVPHLSHSIPAAAE